MKTAEEVVGDLNWVLVEDDLKAYGTCTIRITSTSNGIVVECLVPNPAERSEFRTLSGAHCATCQCNKLNSTAPVPKNPLSKSWHENASSGPKK